MKKNAETGSKKFGWAKGSAKFLAAAAFAAMIIFMTGGPLPSAAWGAGISTTQTDNGAKSEVGTATLKRPVPVGNEICPVSGEKINPKEKATYEYRGKIYNFCCPDYVEIFKKNPEKYIKKMEKGKAAGQEQPSNENPEKSQ
jgi:YHS domain-containing protein